jgi:integrase
VCDQVTLPRVEAAEIEPFNEEESNRFLEACASHRDEALFALAITTGMRIGELLGLRWEDIDWQRGILHVEQAVQLVRDRQTGRVVPRLAKPKTKAAQRPIGLSETALVSLQQHQTRQKTERVALGPDWRATGLVFTNDWGEISSFRTVSHRYKRLLVSAGLPDRRFHDLRHTAATILLLRGVNIKLVSEMLGHADIATTLRIYGHLLPHTHQAAAATMDDVFMRRAN